MPDFGQIAFNGYCEAAGGRSLIDGRPLPAWDDVPGPIQNAWRAAGEAVRAAIAASAPGTGEGGGA